MEVGKIKSDDPVASWGAINLEVYIGGARCA